MTGVVRWLALVFVSGSLSGCPAVTYFDLANDSSTLIIVTPGYRSGSGSIEIRSNSSVRTEFINTECMRVVVDDTAYTFETDFRHVPDDFIEIRMFSTVVYGRFTPSHQLRMYKKGEGEAQDRHVALPSGCGER